MEFYPWKTAAKLISPKKIHQKILQIKNFARKSSKFKFESLLKLQIHSKFPLIFLRTSFKLFHLKTQNFSSFSLNCQSQVCIKALLAHWTDYTRKIGSKSHSDSPFFLNRKVIAINLLLWFGNHLMKEILLLALTLSRRDFIKRDDNESNLLHQFTRFTNSSSLCRVQTLRAFESKQTTTKRQ